MQSPVELHSRPNVSTLQSSVLFGGEAEATLLQLQITPDEEIGVSKRWVVNVIRVGFALILLKQV